MYPKARNPLILRYHRLLEAFSKSDDERDFYLDRVEGFLVYIDMDRGEEELLAAAEELKTHADRYSLVPKLSYYETKKFMEGFVNEKVYDIDTKEKLLDLISGKEARENFLEFIYDFLYLIWVTFLTPFFFFSSRRSFWVTAPFFLGRFSFTR